MSGITFDTRDLFINKVHLSGKKIGTLEDRIREIVKEDGITFTDLCREALRCYVICRDKPLGPKA